MFTSEIVAQPENITEADFRNLLFIDSRPKTFEGIFLDIKYHGIKKAYLNLILGGFAESVARAKIKRVISTKGW